MESTSTLPEFFGTLVSPHFSMLTMTDRFYGATDRLDSAIIRVDDPDNTRFEMSMTLNGSVITQPKDQKDWNVHENTIKSLYLGENMPLQEVIEVMRKRHAFHATERMYKRQFLRWKWRKYNATGYWDSHFNGDQVETPTSRTKCKRPARRKQHSMVTARFNNYGVNRRLQASYHSPLVSGTFSYGNRTDSCISELFINLRDLICGNHRQDPGWSKSRTSILAPRTGNFVGNLFYLAGYFYGINDYCTSGSALRRAFILLEELAKNKAIDVYRATFFDIPYNVPEAVLGMYFRHISRLLSIIRGGEPIARMAMLLERLSNEALFQVFSAVGRMHDIEADLYDEIRGEGDWKRLEVRFEALLLRELCGVKPAQGHSPLLARYDAALKDAASSFGPCSAEALTDLRTDATDKGGFD
ncbi:hypothetical protein CMUS01_11186 [Colletotrichum musicola]|uniref:Clr5 domain-containing protein n=1 Tax=Colletotrichum musicola TaxID=2175873 RepID=A0A8H6JZZ8_9PEZI|nr:hypothetical protein CMUS01_11186 [Colletotrichum musicola]